MPLVAPTDLEMGSSSAMPRVYAQALACIEQRGWPVVHPIAEPASWTVFHWAAAEGRRDICLKLLTAHADPRRLDDQGRSPLDCAREAGHAELWSMLARYPTNNAIEPSVGASNPELVPASSSVPPRESLQDQTTAVQSPSVVAIPPVYATAIAAVEHYGWHAVHSPGEAQWTALHWAASEGRADLCQRLLRCRADPRQPDDTGRTPLDHALERGHKVALRALLTEPLDGSSDTRTGSAEVAPPAFSLASARPSALAGATVTAPVAAAFAVAPAYDRLPAGPAGGPSAQGPPLASAYPTSVRLQPREVPIP